ncbi:ATP-binding protein [Actinospica sp. MGRD01-02]|uniref:ATP-binding protein n=1 Tax=Actinospica acidithermotolerans TaxID=2828514 RepID=A0A941EG75_9ACTN|nr:ATP-binding protein [Actinospica acidithermotolerans]MBR7830168.1 ATP-binding protein [Actinospica acidithermotolerans]
MNHSLPDPGRMPELRPEPERPRDLYRGVVLGRADLFSLGVVHEITTRLPARPASVAVARREIGHCARVWALDEEAVTAALSEIATNAVKAVARHRGDPGSLIRMTLAAHADGSARLEVWNPAPSPATLAPRRARASAQSGRGLLIVEAFAVEVTLVAVSAGTLVRTIFGPATGTRAAA